MNKRENFKNKLAGEGITVLSLFDGTSCGQIALERAGIKVKNYIASEIKKHAIKVTKKNYPQTIHIGDVTKIDYVDGKLLYDGGEMQIEIDLIIGGSPCQDFSLIKSNSETYGLKGEKSKLFYEYLRILKAVNPTYFLLENVRMKLESKSQLDSYLGVEGIYINSSLVSYQNRPRWYWSNIPNITAPEDKNISFQDFKENSDNLDMYMLNKTKSRIKMWSDGLGKGGFSGTCKNVTYSDKINCLTRKQDRSPNSGLVEYKDFCRFLSRKEIEQAQNLPIGYTDVLSYNQMQDVCGDGWTVDVVAHIFSFIHNDLKSFK